MFVGLDLATLLTNGQTVGALFLIPITVFASIKLGSWLLGKARGMLKF